MCRVEDVAGASQSRGAPYIPEIVLILSRVAQEPYIGTPTFGTPIM